MNILLLTLSLLTPDSCLGCGREGSWLCTECSATITYPDMCYVCRKPSPGSLACPKCSKSSPISAMYITGALDGLARDVVMAIKYTPSRSASKDASALMSAKLPYLETESTVVVHVPTTPGRIRERAFDQADVLASTIAKAMGLRQIRCLSRITNYHQVGATKKERFEHMKNAFECAKPELVKGKTVLIVDDVLTTGATLESAARVLKKAGAKRIIATVFARTE